MGFWMIPNIVVSYSNYRKWHELNSIIRKIDLHEDGRFVDMHYCNGRQLLCQDISSLKTLNPEELQDFLNDPLTSTKLPQFYPITIEDLKLSEVALIPRKATNIPNRLLFNRVCQGFYIDFRQQFLSYANQGYDEDCTTCVVDVEIE